MSETDAINVTDTALKGEAKQTEKVEGGTKESGEVKEVKETKEEKVEPNTGNHEEDDNEDDEDEEDESEETEPDPDETPEELVQEAKKLMKEQDFTGALNRFSWAVQRKEKSLGPAKSYPSELASYLLDYGNALLIKEENSNELFSFSKGPIGETTCRAARNVAESSPSTSSSSSQEADGSSSTSSQSDTKVQPVKGEPTDSGDTGVKTEPEGEREADATVTDEQLAWEILEMARMCYANKIEEQVRSGKVLEDDVVDASFVNIRLGDMLTLQEKFADAAKEFETAIRLRKEHNLPYPRLQAPTLSLAQAQLFAGETEAALTNFKLALKLLEDNISGVGGHEVQEDKKADFEATVEDLKIQISETEKTLVDKAKGEESPCRAADGRLRILPASATSTTTNAFDAPQLSGEVISVDAEASSKPAICGTPVASSKKRRIDLSEINAKMVASQELESSSS